MNHIFTDEIKAKLSNPRVLKALDDWFEFGGTLEYPVIMSFVDNKNDKWDILFGQEKCNDWILWGVNSIGEFNSLHLSELESYRMIINNDFMNKWTINT